MFKLFYCCVFLTALTSAVLAENYSSLVFPGGDGKLQYAPYANHGETNEVNKIIDYSFCGYKGGGVALPANIPVKVTLSPLDGDDTQRIQEAIDTVAAMDPDANGIKGAVLLKAGTYEAASTIYLNSSGVVLRGEGQDIRGTVLKATAATNYDLIRFGGQSGSITAESGTTQRITTSYVAVGSFELTVADASIYAVDDEIVVRRTVNDQWLVDTDMDEIGDQPDCTPWTTDTYSTKQYNKITAIAGNTLTLELPVVDVIQDLYGGGEVYRLMPTARISQSGIENIRLQSIYADNTDENHSWNAIKTFYAEDIWVKGVTARFFAYCTVIATGGTRRMTVQDCAYIDPKSIVTGGRRYAFCVNADASQILFQRCYARESRHDYVTGAQASGPVAWVDCYSTSAKSDIGPHHRWAYGLLFDNIRSDGIMAVENRFDWGSGHGWSAVQTLYWNCQASGIRCFTPKGAMNFSIGTKGSKLSEGNVPAGSEQPGLWECQNQDVTPRSLYYKQLEDRLGITAVENVTSASQRSGSVWSELSKWAGEWGLQEVPIETTSPTDETFELGEDVILTAAPLAGVNVLEYKWYEKAGDTDLLVADCNGAALTLPNAKASDSGRKFFVRVLTDSGPYYSRIVRVSLQGVEFPATADARIRFGSNESINYGSDSDVYMKKSSNLTYESEAIVKFDTSTFTGEDFDSAVLNFHIYQADTSAALSIYTTSSLWSENEVTGANAPVLDTLAGTLSISQGVAGWYSLDIADVLDLNQAEQSFRFVITSNDNDVVRYTSKENSSGNTAYISIVPSYKIKIRANADAFVHNAYADSNYGTDTTLFIKDNSTDSYKRTGFVKFELSAFNYSSFDSAKLNFNVTGTVGNSPKVSIYTTDSAWTETGITWNNAPSNDTLVAQVDITAEGWYEVDITTYVNLAQGEHSFKFVIENQHNASFAITSKENSSGDAAYISLLPPQYTPIIGMIVTQENSTLSWALESEVGVREYQIVDQDSDIVIDTVGVEQGSYHYELPEGVNAAVRVVDISGFTQLFLPAENDEVKVTYELSKGWNLIALPGSDADLTEIQNTAVGEFWVWNIDHYEVVENPVVGQAFWVYVKDETKAVVSAVKSESTVKFNPGWNMIGVTENKLIPESAVAVYGWNNFYRDVLKESAIMLQGVGYWLYAEEDGEF